VTDRFSVAARLILLAVLASITLLPGCGTGPKEPLPGRSPAHAQRIVTLAPHLAELVFAAGAGQQLVGVSAFSDYPVEATSLPQIGDAFRVDYEALAALSPDLVLAWTSGNPPALLAQLRDLGYRVVALEPETLDDVAGQIEFIGELAGTEAQANAAASLYMDELASLRQIYSGRPSIAVFYQVSMRPLLTVSGRQMIGQAIKLCGGENIFDHQPGLTPVVSLEAVLDAAPAVILAGGALVDDESQLDEWRRWPMLPANRNGNLFIVDANLMSRPGPRLLDGLRSICSYLDTARYRIQP